MDVVSRALSLTANQLKCKLTQRKFQAEKHSTDFVEVALPSIKHEQTSITLGSRIEIKRADGASMIIEHLSEHALSNLLAKFVKGLIMLQLTAQQRLLLAVETADFCRGEIH